MNKEYRQMQIAEQFPEFPAVLTDEEWKQFEAEKTEFGCVIRALESVTETKATHAEWQKRINQVIKANSQDEAEGETNDFLDDFFDHFSDEDSLFTILNSLGPAVTQQITSDIEQIAKHNSPMGHVLKNMDISCQQNNGSELKQYLYEGKTVMISIPSHLAHVSLQDNKIISLSDGGVLLDIKSNVNYPYITLEQKQRQIEF